MSASDPSAQVAIDLTPTREEPTEPIHYSDAKEIAEHGGRSDVKGGVSPMCSRCQHWIESAPDELTFDGNGRVVCATCRAREE